MRNKVIRLEDKFAQRMILGHGRKAKKKPQKTDGIKTENLIIRVRIPSLILTFKEKFA